MVGAAVSGERSPRFCDEATVASPEWSPEWPPEFDDATVAAFEGATSNVFADATGDFTWRGYGRNIAIDVAKGLCFLHTLQPPMAHFDLKPGNILLSGDEPPRAKLGDVGLGLVVDGSDRGRLITEMQARI